MARDKGIFETLAESGVPLLLAAEAEARAQHPPTHAQVTKLIAHLFWVGVLAVVEFGIIIALLIALLL
jgi:hypothetical protein